ncbi:MAG TPA: hypothetical protein PKM65_20135 [Spirochaetota bacterium]|nr:hypothetical protein [Spirochaetota bacterium]
MGTIADILNSYLPMFDKSDPVYLALVCDRDGVPEAVIDKPVDLNIGVVADMLEYNRRLTISLTKQLFLDDAEGVFLNYFLNTICGFERLQSETDDQYITRVRNMVLEHRCSPAAIINAVRGYSDPDPTILEGESDSAFADVSFTDSYKMFQIASGPYREWWVYPALPVGQDSAEFFFVLVMYNTADVDVIKIIEIVDQFIAAGVGYEIRIEYT